ncbi:MAG: hypothetical protein JXX14_16755 [Deltaproteobacteria bacterium]|nr:hypothetical protein [Deltaproteobacteria bacterium]
MTNHRRYLHRNSHRFLPLHLKRTKKAFQYLPGEWLIVTLNTGRILDCSNDFARLTGLSKTEVTRNAIDAFSFKGDEHGWGLKKLDLELLQHSGRYEDVGLTTPENISMVVDVWVNHMSFAHRPWAFCLITDKSNQRQLQGELISKHQELKRAFSRLEMQKKELEAARNELKRKNRSISDLSAQSRATATLAIIGEITSELTHQLNNPLAAATGACRKLNKLYESDQPEQFGPMLTLLSAALNRLKETIDEVHVIYRHSRTPSTPATAIDLGEQFSATFALLEQRFVGITVKRHIPVDIPPIAGHLSLFQHVIINLLDNAIDASSQNGIVAIAAEKRGERVAVSIGDNGPGIPPYLREKIFEAFYSLKEKGSGLGLAAVKRYVERDNATIEVGQSEYGGAQFTICYPVYEENDSERMK